MNRGNHIQIIVSMIVLLNYNFVFAQVGDIEPEFESQKTYIEPLDLTKIQSPKPPETYGYTTNAGIDGAQINIYEDKSVDCKTTKIRCLFQYDPLLYFAKNERGDMIVSIDNHSNTKVDFMTVYLVVTNPMVVKSVLTKLNSLYKTSFTKENIQPLQMGQLDIRYPYTGLLEDIPNFILKGGMMSESDESYFSMSQFNQIPITFEIPKNHYNQIAGKLISGLNMYVRYTYVSREHSENTQYLSAEIKIDEKRQRDFFGDREKVMASMDQMLEFFYDTRLDYSNYTYVEDERFAKAMVQIGEKFLDYILGSEKNLGEITLKELSSYALSLDQNLVSPNYTTIKKTQSAQSTLQHNIMTEIDSFYKKKSGKGGFSFLKFGAAGGGSSETNSFTSEKRDNTTIKEIAKADEWQGMKIDPLQIKVYEISKASLQKFINANVGFVMAGKMGVTLMATQRDSSRHLTTLDEE